jgi:hypothetical protein
MATGTIRAEDEMRLQRVDVKPYLTTRINPTDHFHHARNIRVRSRFHYNLRARCDHYRDAYSREADWEDVVLSPLVESTVLVRRELHKDESMPRSQQVFHSYMELSCLARASITIAALIHHIPPLGLLNNGANITDSLWPTNCLQLSRRRLASQKEI